MLEHADKIPFGKRCEVKIAVNSQKALMLWKKSSLELAKFRAIPTKQKIQTF